MNLLVTNDDGIDSVFLHEMIFALRDAGHALVVCAPQREQSWISKAVSRTRPVPAAAVDKGFGCPTWMVDGTPTDCVNLALNHFVVEKPDAVVSGINVGLNASLPFILGSGTIAGALEGSFHGLPAVAASQSLTPDEYEQMKSRGSRPSETLLATVKVSAARLAALVPECARGWKAGDFTVHNVNFPFPCRPDTPVRATVPARVIIGSLFAPAENGLHSFRFTLGEDISSSEPLTDRACLAAGEISHTRLDYGRLGGGV